MFIEKSELAAKINKLKVVVPQRTTIESMGGILFKNNTLIANNSEVSAIIKVNTDTDECFILPPNTLELIPKLPDTILKITANENNIVTIKAKGSISRHASFDPIKFNEPAVMEDGETAVVDGEILRECINKTLYASGESNKNPTLKGLYFDGKDGMLNIVGSDGYRLAWASVEYDQKINVIIPRQDIQKLISMGLSGEVKIIHKNGTAMFVCEDYSFYCRLLHGDYLPYKKIIPIHDNEIKINRKNFVDAIERCVITSSNDTVDKATHREINKYSTKIIVQCDKLTVTNQCSCGDYTETLVCDTETEKDLTYSFNAKYMLEALKSFKEVDILRIKLGSGLMPIVLEHENTVAFVLPTREK